MSYMTPSPLSGERPSRAALPTLTVPSRFCGPAGTANGGYMCGRIAGHLDGPVTVTLRRPPPLDTPLTVEAEADGSLRVLHGDICISEAESAWNNPALHVPDTVSKAEARAAEGRARYFQDPAFPYCFVCGPRRGDGLRISPGPVPGREVLAAPWTPDASLADEGRSVRPEIVWAALDCPSGIAAVEATVIEPDTAILLGRMTANVAVLPVVGDECQVIGWLAGRDGRKLMGGSAVLGRGGEVLAVANTVWITVPRAVVETAPGEAS
jgi:hypothetical protein